MTDTYATALGDSYTATSNGSTADVKEWPTIRQQFDLRRKSETASEQDPVEVSYFVEGRLLLAVYATFADRFLTAYTGPDDAPTFEPEDYPLH